MTAKFVYPFFFLLLLTLVGLNSCTEDKCKSTSTYFTYEPVYHTLENVIDSLGSEEARDLKNPGKIYFKDNFLYINEVGEGVHVINNVNPSAPQKVSFIRIPGNYDIAIRDNILYADCFVDLLAIDISNPRQAKITSRVKNVFPAYMSNWGYNFDAEKQIVTTYNLTSHTIDNDCQGNPGPFAYSIDFRADAALNSSKVAFSAPPVSSDGKGGSMARFTLYNKYLYTVTESDLQLINIASPASPEKHSSINVGWGIETIFPYKDKLFIGSTTGMFIYDNQNPAAPQKLSQFAHVRSCDPVVADDEYAYVTLRNGNGCGGITNQLDVIDIRDLTAPKLVKTYPMSNPHGLGKDGNTLFICDGQAGLKVFNAQDVTTISENMLAEYKDIHSFDIIPLEGIAMMIGADGLYQYDYSNPAQIKLLSKIPVVKAGS